MSEFQLEDQLLENYDDQDYDLSFNEAMGNEIEDTFS